MVKRLLVTSAREETWPNDGSPILFLGEWCKLYDRKHLWENLDYEVVPYHWDDRKKLYDDYKNLLAIYESALVAVAVKLNEIHGVNHSLRYWRILLGPWLGYFIQMLFDRWYMLTEAFDIYEIFGCCVLENEAFNFVPTDMADFIQSFVDDKWNEAIYSELLTGFFAEKLKLKTIPIKKNWPPRNLNQSGSSAKKRKFSFFFEDIIKKGLMSSVKLLPSNTRYFCISSYLSPKINFLLQIRLGQIPRFFFLPRLVKKRVEPEKRTWDLELENIRAEYTNFTRILADMIPRHIPTAYLEDYFELKELGTQNRWPRQPEVIFTSNAYQANDVFKAWAAEKTESGSKLVIGQHGGHFGMTPFAFHEEHQIEIADRFISWGWSDSSRPQIEPLGNFKDAGKVKVEHDKNGGALLVQMALPRYSYHLYAAPVSAAQWNVYFKDQERFVGSLSNEIRKNLLVRLCQNDYGCGQESRWRDTFQDVSLDDGSRSMIDLLKKSRLFVSTYNATTYLESFSFDFPTLVFWSPDHWELKEEAKPLFDLLESVGIFHKTPEAAAKKMNEIWDDIDEWWLDPKTQAAKNGFCARYAKNIDQPVCELASTIKGCLKERALP